MIDGNTAALEQHLAEQDKRDQSLAAFGKQAYEELLERTLKERRADVVDIIMNKPDEWFNGDNTNLVMAMELGDPREMGRAIERIMEEAADRLIDHYDVADRAWEIASEGGF